MLSREIRRFYNNRKGLLVAIVIAITFFYSWIKIMKYMWPSYMKLKTDYNLPNMVHLGLYTTSQHLIVYCLGNMICYVLYVSKIPIVE
jgi:hypothetical protein